MSLFKYLDTLTPKVYILQLGTLVLAKVGYTSKDIKARIKDYLHELTSRTDNEWGSGSINPGPKPEGRTISHATLDPEGFTILVAGGFAGAFSQVIPLWGGGSNSQSVTIQI